MTLTLEQLENDVWPEPSVRTSLIDTCHRLRRVPIHTLTAGDIRLLLGQRIGVRHLVPRAIELLREDPLLDASYDAGDLLIAVLRADDNRFLGFPKIREQLVAIASLAKQRISGSEVDAASHHELSVLLTEYEREQNSRLKSSLGRERERE
jgi:CDI immunity proteins